jgi:MFS family permease
VSSDPRKIAAKHFRRNFILGTLNGAAFGVVDSISSPYLVLSIFVHTLGGSNLLVGLLPAISNGGWYLPQFLISHRLQQLPRKQFVYNSTAIIRAACWVALTATTFLTAYSNPTLLLPIFFLLYIISSIAAGVAGTPFMDIVAKTIPLARRSTYFGRRDLAGALTAIGAGYLVTLLLDPNIAPAFPLNFGFIFLVTTISVVGGLGAFALVVEPAEIVPVAQVTFRDQLHAARRLIRENRTYRRYLFTRIVLAIADIASPFYAVYATTVLRIPAETIGAYIGIATIAAITANPVWSRASDRRGNRILLMGVSICFLTMPLIALGFGLVPSGPTLGLPFGLLFLISGIARPAANIGYPSYLLEIAPASERALYIGFANTILGIATFLPVVGGILLDLFGFRIVFLIALAIAIAAWWLARGMAEPRNLTKNSSPHIGQ